MMKCYQRGEAGASMLVLMLVVLGFAWWGGVHGSGHMSSSLPAQEL